MTMPRARSRSLQDEQAQLATAAAGEGDRQDTADRDTAASAAQLAQLEDRHGTATQELARLSADAQSIARATEDAQRHAARARDAASRAQVAQAAAVDRFDSAEQALTGAEADMRTAEERAAQAEAAQTRAEAARSEAQTAEAAAQAARAEAEGAARSLRSEAAALSKLVARDSGADAQLVDSLRVVPGYEQALGAALSDDLRAPLAKDGSGWVALPDYDAPAPLPEQAAPLAPHVGGGDVLTRRLAQVGIVTPDHGPALQPALWPGQRLVTRDGDLWRWDGLHVAARDATGTTALRLEQRNRLAALHADLSRAEAAAQEHATSHDALKTRLERATTAEREARAARKSAEAQQSDAARALSRACAARDTAQSQRDSTQGQLAQARQDLADATARLDELRQQETTLPDLTQRRAALADVAAQVETARSATLAARGLADGLRRDRAARASRADAVAKSLSDWRARRATASARVSDLADRHSDVARRLADARAAPAALEKQRDAVQHDHTRAEARVSAAEDALQAGEAAARKAADAERAAERARAGASEALARAESQRDAAQDVVNTATLRIAEALDSSPQMLLDELAVDPDSLPDPSTLEDSLTRLRRARDALGAVNLRAEEDAREVQGEHDTLVQEKADLDAAIAKLRAGITALNREGRDRLLGAFDKVNANFGTLFQHLFAGGTARLVLVESDDPLDAGLEIMCQPPGKKLSTLSLLSGGEQTLTALALIFAVFLATPAPICVLDEVDAPLDDANVARFCDLLDEMTRRSDTRYLIITHNALTMARMDRLFGVTMAERGVSQLVSVDLTQAEDMVA